MIAGVRGSGKTVYLVMAGLYDNISNLQNEKSLTFLYRAPQIFLEPLSVPAMTTSYRPVFELPPKEAASISHTFCVIGIVGFPTF